MNSSVSIIIPCYRQGRFLAAAIESALGQTHPHVETIVVNDGSTDETDSVARGYGRRITYLAQSNAGVSAARNAGMAAAHGEYLLFLDADDVLRPESAARMVAAAAGRSCVVVQGWQQFTDSAQHPTKDEFRPDLSAGMLPLLLYTNPIQPPAACLCPAAAVRRLGGFSQELAGTEDWDLWIRLAIDSVPFETIDYLGALYRRHAASASAHGRKMIEGKIDVLLRVHRALAADPSRKPLLGPHLFQALRDVLRKSIARGRIAPKRMSALIEAIEQLRGEHAADFATWHERWLDRIFGLRAEWLRVAFWRVLCPKTFRYMATTPA